MESCIKGGGFRQVSLKLCGTGKFKNTNVCVHIAGRGDITNLAFLTILKLVLIFGSDKYWSHVDLI